MLQRWLIISLIVLVLSLGLIIPLQGKPKTNIKLLLSPYSKYAKWIDAQARHESNDFKSELATKYNNIFGMGYPTRRKADNIGSTPITVEGQVMSVYRSKAQAINDFMLWLENQNFPTDLTSLADYVEALKSRGYFTDSIENYYNGLKRWLERNK